MAAAYSSETGLQALSTGTKPGLTALTRMPWAPSSRAAARVAISRAALELA